MPLIRLLYTCLAAEAPVAAHLIDFAQHWSARLAQAGIGGLLLQYRQRCIHVMEGEANAVQPLFLEILRQGHGREIDLRFWEAVAERSFSHWSMRLLQSWYPADDAYVRSFFDLAETLQSPAMFRQCGALLQRMEARGLLVWLAPVEAIAPAPAAAQAGRSISAVV